MNLREVVLQRVAAAEEARFRSLMQAHHYPGALPKIGHTLWYVATWQGRWLALLSISAAAWKCAARDAWIGWDFRHQYDRLHLIANNSRFLILPEHHVANLVSRVLALSERRLAGDWPERFGCPLLLLETFVDPQRFRGTIYRAANWHEVGEPRGYRRTRTGYSAATGAAKRVFVRPLHAEGKAEAKASTLKRLLTRRFGPVPAWAERRSDTAGIAQLDVWLDGIFDAANVADLIGPESG